MKHPEDKVLSHVVPHRNKSNVTNLPGTDTIDLIIENLSEIKTAKIDWIWQDIIAKGKITLFAGEPGVGKSQLLLYIAKVISNGDKFHFEKNPVKQGRVLLIAGEDKMEDTVKPRLLALDANTNNIDHLKGIKKLDKFGREFFEPISLSDHLADIENLIVQNKYDVLIIDPISIYLGKCR